MNDKYTNTFIYDNASEALPELARLVMEGDEIGSRNGERVMEILFPQIVLLSPWKREITTPGRRAHLPAQIAETMWVLSGRDDIGWLSHYLPRAKEFSDDGYRWRGAYGPRIRSWPSRRDPYDHIDQLRNVLDVLRAHAASRRAVISIYDPEVDSQDGKDIPCNNWIHLQSRFGKLHLHVATRSNDLIWGWSGINAFEWSALQEIVAGMLQIGVGELHFSISSLHIYDRHWEKASRIAKQQHLDLGKILVDSPRFDASVVGYDLDKLDDLFSQWFEAEKIIRNRTAAYDVVDNFPEPMLQSWLRIIGWYWSGDTNYIAPLVGTRIYQAALESPKREDQNRTEKTIEPLRMDDPFVHFVAELHREKHNAYGDSWKRRGEQIGIMANIARKVDRLGVDGGGDTAADTVIDLLVYLIKYRLWLTDEYLVPRPAPVSGDYHSLSDHVRPVDLMLNALPKAELLTSDEAYGYVRKLKEQFDHLEYAVTQNDAPQVKADIVDMMIHIAAATARWFWENERVAEKEMNEAFSWWHKQKSGTNR